MITRAGRTTGFAAAVILAALAFIAGYRLPLRRRLVCSSVSVSGSRSVFRSFFRPTRTLIFHLRRITLRRLTIPLRPPILRPRPRISRPPRMHPPARQRRRRSLIPRGAAGPTRKANIAGSTRPLKDPAAELPNGTAPPAGIRAVDGGSSTDAGSSPHRSLQPENPPAPVIRRQA
jgi:hypothetical protein